MAEYTVLGVKGYDFKDDSGNRKSGATLYYIDEPIDQGLMKGYIPFTINIDLDTAKKLTKFPCKCDIDFKRIPNSKGRAIEVFDSLTYVSELPAIQ